MFGRLFSFWKVVVGTGVALYDYVNLKMAMAIQVDKPPFMEESADKSAMNEAGMELIEIVLSAGYVIAGVVMAVGLIMSTPLVSGKRESGISIMVGAGAVILCIGLFHFILSSIAGLI